ncbi:MAG: sigma-70 family RNA polymerase sigma factor [Planctomycetes bacterium]|jgi:RNA polymerase sigma-70 factor (ECF subfamily)|nr:sigma-70 family RNA polymerase sigma factor [Planctomycetota bacterium]
MAVIRARVDRLFARYRRTGDARLLAQVFDRVAPDLWRLGIHLGRDPHLVEDALQNTFLQVVESPHEWDASRSLVPWLLGIMANRVRELRRLAGRAVDPERLHERAQVSPLDAASERELRESLAASLARLEEPYRTTLERHLVQGEAAPEIAAALGVPAGTVRMRLHRGLDRLRDLLPASGFALAGGTATMPAATLAKMRATVLANVPSRAIAVVGAGHTTVAVLGVLAMHKLLLSSLAAIAVAVLWLVWPSADGIAAVVAPQAGAPVAAAVTPAVPMPVGTGPLVTPVRQAADAAPAASGPGRVQVTIQGDGRPLGGLALEMHAGLAPGPFVSRADGTVEAKSVYQASRETHRATTDAAGTAHFEASPGLAAIHLLGGRDTWHIEVLAGGEQQVTLWLSFVFWAEILVVDADGKPVADARVSTEFRSEAMASPFGDVEVGRTGVDGRCRVPSGQMRLALRASKDGYATSEQVILSRGRERAELQLGAAAAVVVGSVTGLDRSDERDCGVMVVPEGWSPTEDRPLFAAVDADGRYECAGVPAVSLHVIAWQRQHHGRVQFARGEAVAVAARTVVANLAFGRGAVVKVELVAADRTPLAGQRVQLMLRESLWLQLTSMASPSVTTDGDGRATIEGLMPGTYELLVDLPQGSVREKVTLVDGQLHVFAPKLAPSSGCDLLLVDEAGQPLSGWTLEIPRPDGLPVRAESDRKGRARLEGPASGFVTVQVSAPNVPFVVLTQEVPVGAETKIVVSRSAMPSASLRGSIVRSGPGVGVRVSLGRVDGIGFQDVAVDAHTGAFAVPALPPGKYELSLRSDDRTARFGVQQITLAVDQALDLGAIPVGAPGVLRVDVVSGAGVSIDELFLAINRPKAPGLFAQPPMQQRVANSLQLTGMPTASLRILVWGPDAAPTFLDAELREGNDTVLTATVAAATRTTLRIRDENGVAVAGTLTIRRDGEELLRERLRAAASHVRGLMPGSYRLEFEAGTKRGSADLVVTPTAGEPVDITVR